MQSIQQLKQNLFVCVFHLLTNWKKAHSYSYTTHMVENKASSHLGMTSARCDVTCSCFLLVLMSLVSRNPVSTLQFLCVWVLTDGCWSFSSQQQLETLAVVRQTAVMQRGASFGRLLVQVTTETHTLVLLYYTFMILFKTKQRCQTAS